MPRRNVLRSDASDSFYHVYARGHSKHRIFLDEQDYLYFLGLLERYLSSEELKNGAGLPYPNFYNKVELNAFCLMPNHFHFLVYQHQQEALSSFMRSVMTSYSRYFNTRYGRSGALFESRFRASLISDEAYLEHVTRYIHLNPRQWRDYEYSSLPYYLQRVQVSWLRVERITQMFASPDEYLKFVADYEENKKMLDILKHELADQF
ncbi:MAG TPA: transposase [Candidatus Saccharimonadales bacterium]|nr:transposase [Candidatus Saccharimonadales bacterium]